MEQKEVNANSSSPNPAEEEGDHTFRQSSGISSGIIKVDDFSEAYRKAPLLLPCSGSAPPIEAMPRRSSTSPKLDYFVKVPHQLRQVNESAYEPQLISIGPYYHGAKPHLIEMEVYKSQCLQRILDNESEQSKDRLVEAMNLERARKWYSPSLLKRFDDDNDPKKFENMMLHDGCFIVELLSKKLPGNDHFFQLKWVLKAIYHDFLLLENQLPFFVLVGLYHVIKDPADGEDFASKAFSVLSNFLPGPKKWKEHLRTIKDTDNIKHLLSLVYDNWYPSPSERDRHRWYDNRKKEEKANAGEKSKEKKFQRDEESGVTKGANHNCFKWKLICRERERENVRKGLVEWQSLRCATKLEEAGIQFMINSTQKRDVMSLFDISFTDATMKIPTFVVEDCTERLFRNLIAYEQYEEGSTYVIDYVTLMDNLVDSAKDVQLLRSSGIIENMLGDDEVVAQMLNKLRDHATLCGDTFYYEEIFDEVQKHCARPWNTWKASLRHDYFNNPWALLSFIAALLVVLLTIGQFITAVIPLIK